MKNIVGLEKRSRKGLEKAANLAKIAKETKIFLVT